MRRFFKSAAFPILLVVILAFIAQRVITNDPGPEAPAYNELIKPKTGLIAEGKIEEVDDQHQGQRRSTSTENNGESFSTGYPPDTEAEPDQHRWTQTTSTTNVHGTGGSSLLSLLTYILPFVLFFGFWIFLMNQMQGGGSRVMNFGKSKAKRMSVDAPKITFRDVAGVDEAVQELRGDQGIPREPEEVPGARRPHPQGRAALRPARHR